MKLKGLIITAICLVFGGCSKYPQNEDNLTLLGGKPKIDLGIWYLNAFEINGADSLLNIYPKTENNVQARRMEFLPKSKTNDGFYAVQTKDYLLYIKYSGTTNLVICNQVFDCECRSKSTCMRNIFMQEKKGLNEMTWQISVPNSNEVILEFSQKRNYRIVLNKNFKDLTAN